MGRIDVKTGMLEMHKGRIEHKFLTTAFKMHLLDKMSDEAYLKLCYRLKMGKKLDLENPQTYNEKLQWLKLHDRKDIYTTMVDKYLVKDYVAGIIGEEHIIPTLGVWDSFDEIDFDKLPEKFVLKCTHDSGGIVICTDKAKFDIEQARNKINKCLKYNYYKLGREWPYKNVKPRIIAEKYMADESGTELKDYKFFCFDGKVKALLVASERKEGLKLDFFDGDFNRLPFKNGYSNGTKVIKKPKDFDEMVLLAEKLAAGILHARIDFYDILGKVYFGEITFFPWSGMTPFEPEEWDYMFGSWINIDNI